MIFLSTYDFKQELLNLITSFIPDFENIYILGTLNNTFKQNCSELQDSVRIAENISDSSEQDNIRESSIAEVIDGRLKGKFVSPNVINLSTRTLSKAKISLLSKGLKFIPTPTSVNKALIKEELECFGRMRLLWHFRNEESITISYPFKKKSTFNPKGKDAAIKLYLNRLGEEIMAIDAQLSYSNLTKEERLALNSLRDDTSIIIKEADKGSGVAVWEREDYLKEAEKQLGDKETYEELSLDPVNPLISIVKNCLSRVKDRGDIPNETLEYFFINKPKLGRFYLLPKIHKRLHNVPGRPVISNRGFFTGNISAFLGYHLKPSSQKVKSFIKDTNDFLKKLNELRDLPDDFILCTIDVVGLYPNIPHKDGLEAIQKALDKREDQTISTDSLILLAECALKNNVFEHNMRYFKQLQGTATGTKFAPPYAILFISYLEDKILNSLVEKPLVWWRYIDDIFMIWQHGEEKLKEFLKILNSCHLTIKFTAEYSLDKVNFLDVAFIRIGNKLFTDLYIKPTDTHQYLEFSSCHVYHSKKFIPCSQALRFNKIYSENRFFDKRCNQLECWLKDRGYNEKVVRQQILKARKFTRKDLLIQDSKTKGRNKLAFNFTYHPAYSKLKYILSNINLLLTPDAQHRKVFPEVPIVGFKRGKRLKDLLVRTKVPVEKETDGKSCGCQRKRCELCTFLEEKITFTNKEGSDTYKIREGLHLDCNSENVIYLIACKKMQKTVCMKLYY